METSFLDSDYESPVTNNGYMKFEMGENKFRIMSRPIMGWEDWIDKKPVRTKYVKGVVAPIQQGQQKVKFFWAFTVWNYATQALEILEITQHGIQKSIANYSKNDKWGDPFNYDIVVNRTGSGLDTEYSVIAEPHTKLTQEQSDALSNTAIDLSQLLTGGDPFAQNGQQPPVSTSQAAQTESEAAAGQPEDDMPF